MYNIANMYDLLHEISPFDLQAKWDNSGINIGGLESCKHIYIALELDKQVLDSLLPQSLLITHHPVIFKPLQNFIIDNYPCNLIAECIKKEICVIAMHTNFDITHLNTAFASNLKLEILGFKHTQTKDFSLIYSQLHPISLESLAKHIKEVLNLPYLRYSKGTQEVNNLYITSGSNANSYMIAKSGDCVITGDIKYHDAMIANNNGISFIEVGHFESECIFPFIMAQALQQYDIKANILHSHNPFAML